jgi:glycerol-3-phosphate dehydrogenase subunit B
MEADVIVVGGGMAGATAALRAAAGGSDVLLIRKGHGSTAMSSGVIDLAGSDGFLPNDPWDTLPTIEDRLQSLLRANPLHPYAILAGGREGAIRLQQMLRDGCAFVTGKIPSLGFRGSHERNMALPTVLGTVKFCAYAPASLAGGDLRAMEDANVLLVGIKGLPYFRPQICRRSLRDYSSQHRPEKIAKVEFIEIEISQSNDTIHAAPFGIAGLFDVPSACEEFAQALKGQIDSGVTHVGVPPILGLDNHQDAFERVGRQLDPKLFELISPTHSIPGHRLQVSLEKALHSNGVRVVTSAVIGVECDGRLIKNLVLPGMKSKRTASAGRYVVATGKFSTGGLVADDFPKEPLFGLPLFVDGDRVDDKILRYLLERDAGERQPFLSCGVHIDSLLRPLDSFGEPAFDNLHAAGSIIGEYDYVEDMCGFGVAALTGYMAGEKAAE